MEIPFRLVDVFTDRPLAGNQLCVVPDAPPGMEASLMQALAREIGFSETTFVSEAAGDRYAMRIFTPGSEMPFAGHPTLGTVFVLASESRITSPATQVVPAGEFRVEANVEAGRAGAADGRLLIRQGMEVGRPSELHLEILPGGQVWVEGGVAVVGRGTFELPD